MLGGLARRASYVEKARSDGNPVLVVDSGDLFFEAAEAAQPNTALAKAGLLAKAYKRMGVTAVNVGDMDLSQGLDFLRQEAKGGLPLISANLLDPSKKTPVFPPYVIKEVSGVKVAFFGLLSPQLSPNIQKTVGDTVLIKDPVDAARATLESLRGKADLVVMLSDLGMSRDHELVRTVPGIRFVLGGHDARFVSSPYEDGQTTLFQSYYKGMYVGKLRLIIQDQSSTFRDEGKRDRIQQEIMNLEKRLNTLQSAHDRQPTANTERVIQQVRQQIAKLEEDLQSLPTAQSGNRFSWSLESLDSGLPENQEIRGWMQGAGIEKD